jgi:nicotinamide mononucleotide adenylyltransferase
MVLSSQRHDAFIGRWRVFHEGHKAMIRKVWEANHRPVLVLVMDTDEEPPACWRVYEITQWLSQEHIEGRATVIPAIASVNYGRGVGYEVNHIRLDPEIESISATKILAGEIVNATA